MSGAGEIPAKDLLDVDDVAGYFGVGRVTVWRWCRDGTLPCAKVGRSWRVRREALEESLRRRVERPSVLGEQLRSFLAVLPAQVAILDGSGNIVAVNGAWRDFAESNGGTRQGAAEGVNYLKICDSATGDQSEYAAAFAAGIRSVLSGHREEFATEYPCHSPIEQRWFAAWVRRFPADEGPLRAVVVHENITQRKRLEQQLRRRVPE